MPEQIVTTIPDPSVLTTQQLEKAIECERSIFAGKIEALQERFDSRDGQLLAHIEAQKASVSVALESLNQLLFERDKAVERAENSRKEAREKADGDLKDKLFEMNKFRDQINRERTTFITREGHEASIKQAQLQIDRNREDLGHIRGELIGKETYNNAVKEWNAWRNNIDKLMNEQAGKGEGISSTTKAIFSTIGAVSLLLGITSMIFSFYNRSDISRNADKIYYSVPSSQPAEKVEIINPPSKPVPVRQ